MKPYPVTLLADILTRCSSHPQGKSEARCFLDTKLTQREDRTLSVTVFRKTHMDRYLHFNSHHPVSAKRAAVRSLFDRARNVTLQKEDLRKEEEHLTATFKRNGYPLPFIRATSSIQDTQRRRSQMMGSSRRK